MKDASMIKMEGESRNSVNMEITQASWAICKLTQPRKFVSMLIKVSGAISSWFILILNFSHRFQTGWQTGWYADKTITFDGTKNISKELTIHGVAQYGQASAKYVIVEIKTDNRSFYFTLNKAIGINKDTLEGANRVVVVEAIPWTSGKWLDPNWTAFVWSDLRGNTGFWQILDEILGRG
jgi:hypothetical protein